MVTKGKKNNCRNVNNDESYDDLLKQLSENGISVQWIPRDEFENKNFIGKGGFADVYSAMLYFIFCFYWNFINIYTFLKLKIYSYIESKNPTFLRCHGISKDSDKYVLVMQYAEVGSLRQNIFAISQIGWEKKLKLLFHIANDLYSIHSLNLIHKDLHSG